MLMEFLRLAPHPCVKAFVVGFQNNFSSDLEGAIESVHRGENWGVMEFRQNFTADLAAR